MFEVFAPTGLAQPLRVKILIFFMTDPTEGFNIRVGIVQLPTSFWKMDRWLQLNDAGILCSYNVHL